MNSSTYLRIHRGPCRDTIYVIEPLTTGRMAKRVWDGHAWKWTTLASPDQVEAELRRIWKIGLKALAAGQLR